MSSTFSSGLFVGVSFLHILPESEGLIAYHQGSKLLYNAGSGPAIVILGVLLGILWIERIGFAHDHGSHEHEDEDGHEQDSVVTEQSMKIAKGGDPVFTDRGNELDLSILEKDGELEDIFKLELAEKKATTKAIANFGILAKELGFDTPAKNPPSSTTSNSQSQAEPEEEKEPDTGMEIDSNPVIPKLPNPSTGKNSKCMVSLILLATMFIHGFFEGMALGVTQNTKATLNIFLAIILHKWAAAISLTLICINKGLSVYLSVICVLCFASATPIGVFFGYLLSSLNPVVRKNFAFFSNFLQKCSNPR